MNDDPERFIADTDDRVSINEMTIPLVPYNPNRKDVKLSDEINELVLHQADNFDDSSEEETIKRNDTVLWKDVKEAIAAHRAGHNKLLFENWKI